MTAMLSLQVAFIFRMLHESSRGNRAIAQKFFGDSSFVIRHLSFVIRGSTPMTNDK
jgi:hypothetical protein